MTENEKEKHEMYLDVSRSISRRAKCKRGHFGAVVVKDDLILGTGFNGPARGVAHCTVCARRAHRPTEGYDLCIAVHAEENAVINSGGRHRCIGADLYVDSHNRSPEEKYNSSSYIFTCNTCARTMINAGIEYVIYRIDEQIIVDHLPTLVDMGVLT